jgi:hypothetical protein
MSIRRCLPLTVLLFTAVLLTTPGSVLGKERLAPARPSTAWSGQGYIAHEWGTFTTVQGSDGSSLGGLMHDDRDLPEFVHDIRDTAGVTGVHGKMETPVIYFYAPEETRVQVRVAFPRGTISQWYPAATRVNHVGPDAGKEGAGTVIHKHENGFIEWGVRRDLIVLAPDAETFWPAVSEQDPWRFCREVDANGLRVCSRHGERKQDKRKWSVGYEDERCLFYRGLADFGLPVRGTVAHAYVDGHSAHVKLTLENEGQQAAHHVFLIYVKDGQAGFHYLPVLRGTARIDRALALDPQRVANAKLVDALTKRLTSTGLFEKEARSMARTWQHAWFGDEGLRVLYVLPRTFVDRELPLQVQTWPHEEQRPDWQVVRTFVGRTELLSPEREQALEQAVDALSTPGQTAGADLALGALARWGRFAYPYLQRAHARAEDPARKQRIAEAMGKLAIRR